MKNLCKRKISNSSPLVWTLESFCFTFGYAILDFKEGNMGNLTICYELQDGGVFTFGAGNYGQLGHNTKQNEVLPKKVFELMGSPVTQIACGRLATGFYSCSLQ